MDDMEVDASHVVTSTMDMEVDPSQSNRWSLEDEVDTLVRQALRRSFPLLKVPPMIFAAKEEYGDYQCDNVLTIWFRIRDKLEQEYPHIKKPRDVGELIKKHLEERGDMIKEASVHDIGFVTFRLSGKWIAESIHQMVRRGIETWAPKLFIGKVMIRSPSLENDAAEGKRSAWFRRAYIIKTLHRMLKYSKADVTVFKEWPQKDDNDNVHCKVKECFSIEESDGNVTISVVGPEGERKPIICGKRDGGFGNVSKDLSNLWYGLECEKAKWIVNVIPAQQQEYYEMCFSAAREARWLPDDRYEPPQASYAGYRTCSNEVDKLITFLQQRQAESDEFPTTLLDNALAYTFLKTHRLVDCTLNLVEMLTEEGDAIQHLIKVLAQIRLFTTKSSEDVHELKKASKLTLGEGDRWEDGIERVLGLHLLTFTEVLKESCASILPHILCKYLHDLSEKFECCREFYESSVCQVGVVVEPTTRLLLYEATAVVMEKCFHLLGINLESASPEESIARSLLALSSTKRPMDVNAPLADVESDNKKQKTTVGVASEDSIITHLLRPVVARDLPTNPRFEPFSLSLNVRRDPRFKKGQLLGHISVSDNIGLLTDAWVETYEPEFSLVTLFNRDWCDSEDMVNFGFSYFCNISSRQSIPFSSYMEISLKLFVTNDEKDAVFQLCNHESDLSFRKFWKKDINSTCSAIKVPGKDGHVMLHYILLRDAVDAAIELTCTSLDDNLKVHGEITAYYGNNFDYQCHPGVLGLMRSFYTALLYQVEPTSLSSGAKIQLRKSVMAVPNKDGSLVIELKLANENGEEILDESIEFLSQTEGHKEKNVCGVGCSFRLRVDWSQGKGYEKAGMYLQDRIQKGDFEIV